MKRVCENLFRAVGFCFSALLLILSLLTSIKLAAVNDRAVGLEQQVAQLEEDNAVLRARCESSLSLEEIERYATQELGMQRCLPGQIQVLRLDSEG